MDFTYENFWDMFQDIPALELPQASFQLLDEYRIVNDNDRYHSKARLIHNKRPSQRISANSGLAKKPVGGDETSAREKGRTGVI